ncbi:hypothetical protein BU251_08735 [Candidatus Velamenicoccus archaeovorus]|uniref:Uncharacterized protein n=1 Tax=Velamenicoccus archaeovorus TaxID=1930593 RepID=A0A410P6I5_VELA1|nr:hypothetical protein [Candidatus Velamenicoccus archaeovorus]QAT17799.1 hypothetical protein BU251_08735 [Candidatus Velamenicoccus archaeovorus]
MAVINLNQKLGRIEIKDFELSNNVVFNFFNNIPVDERDEKLIRAIYIGVLALMEDRISAFLAKTTNELGTELESLKMIFEMKKELFYKTTVKGFVAEDQVAEFLNNYFTSRRINDKAVLIGNATGVLPKNKTGDIICELNGDPSLRIAIECKFDKSIRLGDIESKDIFTKKMDTAWSQLLEAQVNRDSKVGIIVFDISLIDNSILKAYENVGYIKGIGFVAVINSQSGDYSNLAIAYMLARDIALNAKGVELDTKFLSMIINRIIKDINDILNVKRLVEANIANNKEILKQLERSMMLMEFNQAYLTKFLKDGKLSKKDMLDFYLGEDVRDKYRALEKEIDNIQ